MKRSEFIKKVLKSQRNTVFTNEEQVKNALEVFESFGMLPPDLELAACGSFCSVREMLDYSEIDYTVGWEDE